jgi:hypothetical protein
MGQRSAKVRLSSLFSKTPARIFGSFTGLHLFDKPFLTVKQLLAEIFIFLPQFLKSP